MIRAQEPLVWPPDGPLVWLFPELREQEAAASNGDLDLRHGATLASVIAAAGAGGVRVPDGPRGRALAAVLRSAARRAGRTLRVRLDPSAGPSLETTLRAASTALPGRLHPRAREAFGIPFFDTDPGHPVGPVHTRLAPGWWGLLPGDVWPEAERQAWLTMLRARFPDRVLRFLALENHALAGIDLFGEALARSAPLPSMAARQGPLVIGIDGIDGTGKSTHLELLHAWLERRGLRVVRHKLYRHGVFHDTVTDMTRMCAGAEHLHLWPLQRHAKLLDSLKYWHEQVAPSVAEADVLLFDRYVQTHLAAGTGRYHHDPYAREFLAALPRADLVFLLDLPIDVALQRLAQRRERTVDENPYMLGRFRAQLLQLALAGRHEVLDATAPVERIQTRMRAAIEALG